MRYEHGFIKATRYNVTFLRRKWQYERRDADSAMGRHGGGWNVKIGVQAASWKELLTLNSVIFGLGGSSLSVRKPKKKEA